MVVLAQGFEERAAAALTVDWLAIVFSVVATVASAVFTVQLVRRWHAGGRRNAALRHWAVGLALFCVASATLLLGEVRGWSAASFRVFYLFGGVLNVPWLALGSVTINSTDRTVSRWTGIVTLALTALFWVLGGGGALFTPALVFALLWALVLLGDSAAIRAASVALMGVFTAVAGFAVTAAALRAPVVADQLPEGRELLDPAVRGLSVAGNATGSLLVVVGAALSAGVLMWRHASSGDRASFREGVRGDRSGALAGLLLSSWRAVRAGSLGHVVKGNLLIALGVLFAGASGGMFSFLGETAGHAFGFGTGVTVMYVGFRRTTRPLRPPAADATRATDRVAAS